MTAPSKREIKHEARRSLMNAMISAFYSLADEGIEPADKAWQETERQFRRAEKLFGFKPGSWSTS